MTFGRWLVLLLPLTEIVGFIVVITTLGFWKTLLLSIALFLLGVFVLRQQGMASIGRVLGHVSTPKRLGQEALEGTLLLMAGLFLIIPGFCTSFIGLLFLIPFIRRGMVNWILDRPTLLSKISYFQREMKVIEGEMGPDSE